MNLSAYEYTHPLNFNYIEHTYCSNNVDNVKAVSQLGLPLYLGATHRSTKTTIMYVILLTLYG